MSRAPLLPAPAHDSEDPLSTAAERLPLAWPRSGQPTSGEIASPKGVRPFGLRFAVRPSGAAVQLPPWRYCPDRQIAVTADGQPWRRTLVDMTMNTTGPSPDGTGNTGNEEWSPDFMSDEPGEPAR
jgi:putative ATP-grasp target RiPP